eukprot:437796-Rhodomonas_salina.4
MSGTGEGSCCATAVCNVRYLTQALGLKSSTDVRSKRAAARCNFWCLTALLRDVRHSDIEFSPWQARHRSGRAGACCATQGCG